jgi:hypothetical protein
MNGSLICSAVFGIRRRCLGVSLAWMARARGLDGSLVIPWACA